jgi:hypothetical protein
MVYDPASLLAMSTNRIVIFAQNPPHTARDRSMPDRHNPFVCTLYIYLRVRYIIGWSPLPHKLGSQAGAPSHPAANITPNEIFNPPQVAPQAKYRDRLARRIQLKSALFYFVYKFCMANPLCDAPMGSAFAASASPDGLPRQDHDLHHH